MNIGEAASRSGLPTKTIRYYELIGLVSPTRRPNGFRDYNDADVARLRFIGSVRGLGFSVEESRQLLELLGEKADGAEREGFYQMIASKQAELRALEERLRSGVAGLDVMPDQSRTATTG